MKHLISFIAAASAAMLLTGCGDTSKVDGMIASQANSPQASSPADIGGASVGEAVQPLYTPAPDGGYDIDLTQLSSSMVYAQVYDMVYSSDKYVGQSVKVKGPFSYFKDPETGEEYFAVLINDAAACCSQGIEFVLSGEYVYPDDYPEVGTEITVTGDFIYYTESVYTYCQLQNAVMTVS